MATLTARINAMNYNDIIANITATLNRATNAHILEGSDWYDNAHDCAVALLHDANATLASDPRGILIIDNVADSFAALSPQNPWPANACDSASLIYHYIDGYSRHDITAATYGANVDKAWRLIVTRDRLTGQKTLCFTDNIAQPLISVRATIDIWAIRAALADMTIPINSASLTPRTYAILERAYCDVARANGLRPHVVQAIVWCVVRRIPHSARSCRVARTGIRPVCPVCSVWRW